MGECVKKILLVDDSKTFHHYLREAFQDKFEIISILDPTEALKSAVENSPDLILLDLEMPIINGFELSIELHLNQLTTAIPVLILTGSYSEKLILKAIESFSMDILPKDSSKEFLLNKIHAIIRQKEIITSHVREKQLNAVRALISLNNHELNNALQISNSYLDKALKSSNEEEILKFINKGLYCNKRIHEVVMKLNNLEETEVEDKESKIPMLKLK